MLAAREHDSEVADCCLWNRLFLHRRTHRRDRYPRFRHFFDRNHKIITILLTAVGLVVGLSAVYAARDAANAAKDQVILQTSPFVGTAPRPFGGFTYEDGRRLAGNHPSPYDVGIVGSTFYGAVALENIGPGFAVIHLTRWGRSTRSSTSPTGSPQYDHGRAPSCHLWPRPRHNLAIHPPCSARGSRFRARNPFWRWRRRSGFLFRPL
jgi:hypothetical protein